MKIPSPARCRGRLINISNAERVVISGIHCADGPSWNIHMVYSRSIWTHHCRISSRGIWNGDGWDPDSSENCILFDTVFDTDDDMVAIKSGKNPEGNVVRRSSHRIRVFDCIARGGHGIAIGSEVSGGISDIAI